MQKSKFESNILQIGFFESFSFEEKAGLKIKNTYGNFKIDRT
ncbi:hypothetical protein LEP1GSC083_1723 [Leptospira interrogans serovar Pyrogenes str. L0374]|uniref:Uncharacterized protein n=4 Tax=Leptospira interrogans TaxID=173 RepID=A0A0E2CZJ8_LEPIR|nr:hypothetical protein LEP1GSC077_1696 [Leptospira interrogans str. C10069]EKO23869.1 hypothetical protein LEP1GSC104_2312 [Leptospira interrogans str. UI 12621]EKO68189.1 hypothetical protein LEP1GSC069_1190 [Leptospira interrogans serovar Canicola str. Fiocruz LV133]EKO85374.1 hypothetical protein LEP1GSC009_1853 [Leptospira interrogans serovar Grippotyphosa str. Andaman]EKP86239.1 hypothetical protein LEP1GSC020_3622 [Leptospira interrogans serovar Grippotyphosa str. 2006006986]EKR34955.1 